VNLLETIDKQKSSMNISGMREVKKTLVA